jgi:hypothetical protein
MLPSIKATAGKAGSLTTSTMAEDASGEDFSSAVESSAQDAVAADRRIIYTAYLEVEVEEFTDLPERVAQLVEQYGGYISGTTVHQLQGSRRSGSWVLRIPTERYRDFLQSASGLGVPQSLREDAQDVSEEFVDLEARISSSKKLEEQYILLLEKQTEKVEDLLAIEKELARVRLEIERMEGRLRYLANQVAMSTVNLTAIEKTTFIAAESPSLSRRAAIEWSEAKGRTIRFFEESVIFFIANAFVILGWIIFAMVVWFAIRAIRRRFRRRAAAPAHG